METVPTNVPISELESTPISKKPARSHKKKSHSAKVEGQASKGHGSQTPVALVNPFSKRPIIGGKEDQDLTEDVYLIKGETVPVLNPAPPPLPSQQAHRRGSGSHSALSTTMSLRNVKDTRGTSPVRPSTRSGSAKGAPEEDDDSKQGINNDDHCSACLGRGRLLCCDMCPKAFHFHCVEEAFESIDDVPQDSWECRSCRARKRAAAAKKGKRKSGSPANSLLPSGNRSFGVFDSLLNDLEGTNPRVFQLPREIVDSFENVYMHPATGAYIDTREMEVARPRVKSHRKGASAEAGAENKRSTSAGVGSGDPTAVSGASHLCFKCGESGYRLHTTSFLASFSFPQSDAAVYRPQAVRTELVKCDYCPLFWHLDCLNPPLTCIPPEMKEDEKEVVDVTHWNTLRNRTWGVEERGGRAEIVSNVPLPVGGPAKLDAGLIQIRKKWMCPCHVDWSLPKLRVNSGWKWVEVSENSPPYVSEGAEEAKITPPVANHAPPAVSLKVDDDEPVSPAAAAKARAASARADSKPVDDEPDSPAAGARPRAASGRAGSVAKRRAADEDLAQLASSGALKKSRTGSATPHRRKEVQHLDKYSAAAALAATSTPTTRRAAPSNTPTSTTAAVRGPSVAAPAGPSRAVIHIADSANNGDVEVINDPLTLEYYAAQSNQQKSRINSKKGASAAAKALLKEGIEDLEFGGVKYRLPERRIKLEFFEHVRSLPTIVRLPPAPTADVAPTGSSILNDPTKDQSFQSAFGHIGRSFRSRVDELYSSSDNANEQGRGLHSANAASLCYAAAVASDGVAEKCKGRLRATDEEAMEWLESVTMMQSELAYLINTRRAANAYVAQQDNHVSATAPHQADNNNNNNNSTSSGSDNTNNDTDKHPLAAPSSAPAKDAPLPPAPLTSTIATPAPGAPDDDTVVGISRAEYDAFLEWKRKNGNRSGSNTNPDDTTKS
ncbi:hypothetical protein DFJ77DRAFT_450465 [Powellomyces hirtus]|nr:hypothetical protein DFJ77DRAFT_450465 [Powellomyces hirtus]